jgi:hypothetical protein
MSTAEVIDAPKQRRRLAVMLGVNLVCLLVAAWAGVEMIGYRQAWGGYVFAGAIVVGFAAHLWLVLGLSRPKGSV